MVNFLGIKPIEKPHLWISDHQKCFDHKKDKSANYKLQFFLSFLKCLIHCTCSSQKGLMNISMCLLKQKLTRNKCSNSRGSGERFGCKNAADEEIDRSTPLLVLSNLRDALLFSHFLVVNGLL